MQINIKPLLLVLSTVILGIVSALILKEASGIANLDWRMILMIGLGAALTNGLRFIIWGIIHKNYPLSLTYPLNSVFFPLILALGYFYGEKVTFTQIVAVLMITAGIAILSYEKKNE